MRWLLLLPVLVIAILFGGTNEQVVTLGLWPSTRTVTASLGVCVLVASGVTFLCGALVAWFTTQPELVRQRDRANRAERLERENAELRAKLPRPVSMAPGGAIANLPRLHRPAA